MAMESNNQKNAAQMPPGDVRLFYESLLNSLPLGVYRVDCDGRITFANTPMLNILNTDTTGAIGHLLYDFFPEHRAAQLREDDQWIFSTGKPINKVEKIEGPALGVTQYLREIKSPICSATGELTGVQGIFWDISEQMQAQSSLTESDERFNLFMDTLPAAAFIKNEDSTTVYCNRYMADIIGAKKFLGKTARELFPKEVAEKMIEDDKRSLAAGYVVVEEQVPHADGQIRIYQTHKFAIPRKGLSPLLGGIALDITERKQAELELKTLNARLKLLATTDQLTELANRRQMTETLNQEIDRVHRYEEKLSVIMADIDHFKSINDQYGHQAGDSVLKQFAAILAAHVRTVDTPGRWGGEEFLIICPETPLAGASSLAELIRHRVEQHDFGIPRHITASFGVAASKRDSTADSLMKSADDALYLAKTQTRNRVVSAPD